MNNKTEISAKPAFFWDRPLTQLATTVASILMRKQYKVIEVVNGGRISYRIVPDYQKISKSA